MFTPQLLTDIRDKLRKAALRASGESRNRSIQRETAALNGQVMRVRGGGKRVAEPWTNGRWNPNDPTKATGAVGMASHAHVSRNLKTAKLKRYVAPRWHAAPVPEAYGLEPYITDKGELRYRRREIGTGAYDPRVRYADATVGIRKEVTTGTRLTRMVQLGGRLIEVAV
jgi:hypothetical protein